MNQEENQGLTELVVLDHRELGLIVVHVEVAHDDVAELVVQVEGIVVDGAVLDQEDEEDCAVLDALGDVAVDDHQLEDVDCVHQVEDDGVLLTTLLELEVVHTPVDEDVEVPTDEDELWLLLQAEEEELLLELGGLELLHEEEELDEEEEEELPSAF